MPDDLHHDPGFTPSDRSSETQVCRTSCSLTRATPAAVHQVTRAPGDVVGVDRRSDGRHEHQVVHRPRVEAGVALLRHPDDWGPFLPADPGVVVLPVRGRPTGSYPRRVRRPGPPGTQGTCRGRLALLVVLAAGFLTMHGFFAVSAGADVHGPATAVPVEDVHPAGHPAGAPGLAMSSTLATSPATGDAAFQVSTTPPAPSPHPADHHDVLAGCVVALVGVAVLALAHMFARRGPLAARRLPRTVPRVLPWVGDHAPALPPPRIALCVVRV